jgi:hypothetical protein
MAVDAMTLKQERLPRELDMTAKVKRNAELEFKRKIDAFVEALQGSEKSRFVAKMNAWKELF